MNVPIKFDRSPNGWTLTTACRVEAPIDRVFAFFADAHNLERITPPWVGFQILTPGPIEMRPGAIIDYRIRLWGVPVRWRTEISVWEPGIRFVDRQVRGPYTLWEHEHRFEADNGGTLCRDRVAYSHRGGPVGEMLVVRPQLRRIFGHRWVAVRESVESHRDASFGL